MIDANQILTTGRCGDVLLNEIYAVEGGGFKATLCAGDRNLRGSGETPLEAIQDALIQ